MVRESSKKGLTRSTEGNHLTWFHSELATFEFKMFGMPGYIVIYVKEPFVLVLIQIRNVCCTTNSRTTQNPL